MAPMFKMFAFFIVSSVACLAELVQSSQQPSTSPPADAGLHGYTHADNHGCCDLLAKDFPSRLSYPGNDDYQQFLSGYWSECESRLEPDCIFTAGVAEDVAHAVGILSKTQCRFAVRGGGHTGWAGAANTDSGVTFDLTRLNKTTVAPDRSSVTIGAGARWNGVYEHLDDLGLHVAGGRYPSVGVSGLTLGGGISFFSPRYGWVCDTVLSFELVMADGTLETVSAFNKPDLYRALKGGSNNIGIVTAINFRAFPGGSFLMGTVTYDAIHTDSLITAFAELASTPVEQYDEYAAYLQLHTYDKTADESIDKGIINWLIHTKVPANNISTHTTPPFLSKLAYAAPQLNNTLAIQPIHTFLSIVAIEDPARPRRVLTNMNFRITKDPTFMLALVSLFDEAMSHLAKNIPHFSGLVAYQPLHPIMTSRSAATGGNVLGLGPDAGYIVNADPGFQWAGAENDALVQEVWEKVFADAQSLAEEYGVATDWLYLNYAEKWQDPIKGYGKENVEFLREVSRKYDPKGVFQHQLSGGFKLWKKGGSS